MGVTNCTHSTHPRSRLYSAIPRLDAPVIYIGAFPILTARPGRRSIYNSQCILQPQPTGLIWKFGNILVNWGTIQQLQMLLTRPWRWKITLDNEMVRSPDTLRGLEHGLGIYAFWPTCPCLIFEFLASRAKFLQQLLYCDQLPGILANVLDCALEVSEFKPQLRYQVHFRTNTIGKGINPFIPSSR